ncbi:MAG: hypothetical protein RLN90_01190 [Balneolaceae bacterium]
MKKNYLRTFFLCFTLIVNIQPFLNAQSAGLGQFFLSGNMGGYSFSKEIKKEAYGTVPEFEYGGTAGFPVGSLTHIYIKGAYFESNGDNVEDWVQIDGEGNLVKEERRANGTSNFKMWRINAGFQHAFLLQDKLYLLLNGGATFIRAMDRIQRMGEEPFKDNREGWLGFFGGLGIEKKFESTAFSLFSEAQYNTTNKNLILWIGDFGGYSYSFGVRYYLPEPKKTFR